jgi:hypothetical protein
MPILSRPQGVQQKEALPLMPLTRPLYASKEPGPAAILPVAMIPKPAAAVTLPVSPEDAMNDED